jgi:hypothetical protein
VAMHFASSKFTKWFFVLMSWMLLACGIQWSHLRLNAIVDGGLSADSSIVIVPKYDVVRLLCGGNEQLIADCWWLSFIQYYGDVKNRKFDHNRYAYNYLDLITQLDPKFTQPYWFAAFAVGADARRPEKAQLLIDRGIRANPDSWYIPFIGGINQYLFAGNDKEAARYYRLAARHEDAPMWIGRQAKILDMQIPSFIKEIKTWESIYLHTNDEIIKAEARRKLLDMWQFVYKMAPTNAARMEAKAAAMKVLNVNLDERR